MSTTLVLLPNWLGDAVMCAPALALLRQSASVVGVGSPALVKLLLDLDLLDEGEFYDRRGADAGLGSLLRLGRRLRSRHVELVLVLPPSLRAGVLAWLSGARRRRGFRGDGRRLLLNEPRRWPGPPRGVHLADAWLSLAEDAPLRPGAAVPRLCPGPRGRQGLEALVATEPRLEERASWVVLAPGATFGPTKRWPADHYVALGRELSRQHGWEMVVVGSKDPTEQQLCQEIASSCQGLSLAGRTDLPTLAALLEGAAAFVGNDSGPMHLAAAVGTPTLGVFGSSSPKWTAPRGPRAASCGPHAVECAPCFRSTCDIGIPCLTELGPTEVLRSLEALLQENTP